MKIGLATHGGHTDAIAIATNARNHALHQMLHLGVIGIPETQRVHIRHWPRAHGKDIAQYATDARCRALIGFDIARVIMRFHFENRCLGFPSGRNIDHAGIFAGTADHPRRFGGQFFQVKARAFV